MSRNSQHNPRGGRGGGGQPPQGPGIDLSRVVLKAAEGAALDPDLFSDTAEQVAKVIGQEKIGNKPSQIRKFFDELVMWEERVRQSPDPLCRVPAVHSHAQCEGGLCTRAQECRRHLRGP